MANKNTLKVWLQELYDTEANLSAAYDASESDGSKTLLAGRLAFDSESNNTRYKIGDGETAFANLPWNYATVPYGTCDTAQTTAAKTVTIPYGFVLATDTVIAVKFTNGIKVAAATLNVNSTGAKNIWYNNANITASHVFAAKRTYLFRYNGTQWELIGDLDTDSNTTYTNASLGQGYGTCTTAADTAAKVVTLSSYALTTGGIVSVKFTNAVNIANVTLNINSKGAKSVFYHGAVTTATEIIPAGAIGTFIYDGTQYHLIAIDTINLASNTITGTLPVSKGGTGKTSHTSNSILTGNGGNAVNNVATANGAAYATSANGALQFGTLPVAQGGTGTTTFTSGQALIGNGGNAVTTRAIDTTAGGTNGSTSLITSGAVYTAIENVKSELSSLMEFKGTLGKSNGSGTISALPTTGVSKGDAYKIIEENKTIPLANAYQSSSNITAKIGDTIVAMNTTPEWLVIPSGDEPSGTVTSVGAGAGLTTTANGTTDGGTITSSGSLNLTIYNTDANSESGGEKAYTPSISGKTLKVPKITYDKYGRVKKIEDITLTTQDTDTDTKVKQTTDTGTTERALILNNGTSSGSAGEVGMTSTAKLKVKPSTGDLTSAGDLYAGGLTSSAKGTGSGETVVGKVNAWNLVQTSGDVLILNGNI